LRRLLEQQLAALAWNDLRAASRRRPRLWWNSPRSGSAAISRGASSSCRPQRRRAAQRPHLALLARHLPVAPAPGSDGGCVALVGPSGAGKTPRSPAGRPLGTEHGSASLLLMSIDDDRIGGASSCASSVVCSASRWRPRPAAHSWPRALPIIHTRAWS
jgi:hypothetical protein